MLLRPLLDAKKQAAISEITHEVQLNKREKAILFFMTLFTGLGSGTGVGLGTFSIIAGAGFATTVGTAALFWILVAGVASAFVAVPIMYMALKDHLKANRKLINDITELMKRQAKAKELVEKNMQIYFLTYLRMYLLYQDLVEQNRLTRDEEFELKKKMDGYPFSENLPALRVMAEALEQTNATTATTLRKSLAPSYSAAAEFKLKFESDILPVLRHDYLERLLTSQPRRPGLGGPIKSGIITCLGVFSTVSGTAWGVASMILGAVVALTAPVSFLAFTMLGVGLLIGVAVGVGVGYYKYRKAQREKLKSHLIDVNQQLDALANEIDSKQEAMNEDYRVLKKQLIETQALRSVMSKDQIELRRSQEITKPLPKIIVSSSATLFKPTDEGVVNIREATALLRPTPSPQI